MTTILCIHCGAISPPGVLSRGGLTLSSVRSKRLAAASARKGRSDLIVQQLAPCHSTHARAMADTLRPFCFLLLPAYLSVISTVQYSIVKAFAWRFYFNELGTTAAQSTTLPASLSHGGFETTTATSQEVAKFVVHFFLQINNPPPTAGER